jgi:hypothetical protein
MLKLEKTLSEITRDAITIVSGAIKERKYLTYRIPNNGGCIFTGYCESRKLYFVSIFPIGTQKEAIHSYSEDPRVIAVEYILGVKSNMNAIKSVAYAVYHKEVKYV